MTKSLKIFLSIFIGVYFLFALKYMTPNLFQYFEYDYFNLNKNLMSFWSGLGLSESLNSLALIDLTYIKENVYNNNGTPISLLYALLGKYSFGPFLLVVIISLHLLSVKYLADESGQSGNRALICYFSFVPIIDLFFTKMFTSEIATWYALCFLSWGLLYLQRKKYLVGTILLILTVLTRSEYIVICSLLALLLLYGKQKSGLFFFVGIGVMFYRNYLWTGNFPSFADGNGRLHDALVSYYELSLLENPSHIFLRIWFHLKSLLFFDPSMTIFSLSESGLFYLGSPLAIVIFYWWIPLVVRTEIKEILKRHRVIVLFCFFQFFAISIASETFFVRYAFSYLFIVVLIVSFAASRLPRKRYLFLLFGQSIVLLIYHISFKPLVFENEKLVMKPIDDLIKTSYLDNKSWATKIKNEIRCDDDTISDRLLKGVEKENGHCFLDKHWVSINKSLKGNCIYRIVFKTEEECSRISYKNNYGQVGKLSSGIMSACYYENVFEDSVVISQFEFPDDGAREVSEVSFSCL